MITEHTFVLSTEDVVCFSMDIFGLYRISYLYIGFLGFMTTLIISLIVSFITGINVTAIHR